MANEPTLTGYASDEDVCMPFDDEIDSDFEDDSVASEADSTHLNAKYHTYTPAARAFANSTPAGAQLNDNVTSMARGTSDPHTTTEMRKENGKTTPILI